MSALPPLQTQTPTVRRLLASIAVMTLAMAFMLGMIVGRLLTPSGRAEPPKGTIDFAAAPEVEIGLPPGARVIEQSIEANRITMTIGLANGETAIFTTPIAGLDGPARIVYRSLE